MISLPEPRTFPAWSSIADGVRQYNQTPFRGTTFGEIDAGLWERAKAFTNRQPADFAVEELQDWIWAVKKWGSIQVVWHSDKVYMAQALRTIRFPEDHSKWTTSQKADWAFTAVCGLSRAGKEAGVHYYHLSWASKILHWMLPELVPVYDALIRAYLGYGSRAGEQVYRGVVDWEHELASRLTEHRGEIVGDVEPTALLRAIDKFLWIRSK